MNSSSETLKDGHLLPPFISIEGIWNCRSLPLPSSHDTKPILLRSGNISRITACGMSQLRAAGIRKIFDLRSPSDVAKFHAPAPVIDGIEINMVSLLLDAEGEKEAGQGLYDDQAMIRVYSAFRDDEIGAFMNMYTKILEQGCRGIGQILRNIASRDEDEGIMFHCSAGKDRTGVLAAVILSIAGVDDIDIVNDYALTSVGLGPNYTAIIAAFEKDASFQANREGALNMLSARPETMRTFLALLREKYGGAEGYVRKMVGLTETELENLKKRLKGAK